MSQEEKCGCDAGEGYEDYIDSSATQTAAKIMRLADDESKRLREQLKQVTQIAAERCDIEKTNADLLNTIVDLRELTRKLAERLKESSKTIHGLCGCSRANYWEDCEFGRCKSDRELIQEATGQGKGVG